MLLLFDIDGTLVRTRPVTHQRAMARAAVEVLGLPPSTDEAAVRAVEPWGKTDRWILRDLLAAAGRTELPGEDERARWENTAFRISAEIEDGSASDEDRRTSALLERLSGAGHRLSLVTGNLEPIARHKLGVRGLGGFFERGQGGFGSDAEVRADLVRLARVRAGAHPAGETVLIGDTPRDVEAALAAGVRAIAVAGGRYTRDDLVASGAHAAVDELVDVEPLL